LSKGYKKEIIAYAKKKRKEKKKRIIFKVNHVVLSSELQGKAFSLQHFHTEVKE